MIAVIADDLTGAAELGGIGLRHGLRTEIRTAVGTPTDADLLVIAADSRSKAQKDAIKEMTTLTRELRLHKPEWIYKKTDSVLRGHVIAELNAHLQALDYQLALLVPANPSLGRTIRNGHYYLNDQPIHHSPFSADPEFPIRSSDLQDMLHTKEQQVQVRTAKDQLPVRGIVVGEAQTNTDLHAWATRIHPKTLLAGAAGFFSAILDTRLPVKPAANNTPQWGSPILFVSGSTFDTNRKLIRHHAGKQGPVTYMSETSWQQQVIQHLQQQGKAIIAIDDGPQTQSAGQLRTTMADGVAHILKTVTPAELIIEGGSTAYAILQQAGWHAFLPEQELAQGVVRMSVPEAPGLFITVKPGSYHWPPSIHY